MATYLYSKDCPEGRVFNTQEEVDQALKDGWFDAPGKWDNQKSPGPLVDTQAERDVTFFDNDESPDEGKPRSKKNK